MKPKMSLKRMLFVLCLLNLALGSAASAQQARAKRSLTHDDYDSWRSIQSQRLSSDGRLLAYALTPQDGDGEIVVRNLATGTEWRYGIGSRQVPTDDDEEGGTPAPAGNTPPGLFFTSDTRFVVFQARGL